MSSIAKGVRIDCVTCPGGWERNAVCVCSSERARHCETRVLRGSLFRKRVQPFSPRRGVFSETKRVGRKREIRRRRCVERGNLGRETVGEKSGNESATVNDRKVKSAETRDAADEWNS